MIKFAFTLLAAATVAAPALAATTLEFERDGVNYVATVDQKDDVQTIVGHEVQTGRPFALRVVHGKVSGTYDNMPVSYDAPRSARAVQTASR